MTSTPIITPKTATAHTTKTPTAATTTTAATTRTTRNNYNNYTYGSYNHYSDYYSNSQNTNANYSKQENAEYGGNEQFPPDAAHRVAAKPNEKCKLREFWT